MNSAKESELDHLIEFFRAASIVSESLQIHECPDFIAVIDGRTVGIELTIARHEAGRFGALQIEHAQSEYAQVLRRIVVTCSPWSPRL